MASFCTNCGKKIEDGINFCPYCGSPQSNMSVDNDVSYYNDNNDISFDTNSYYFGDDEYGYNDNNQQNEKIESTNNRTFIDAFSLSWKDMLTVNSIMSRGDYWKAYFINAIFSIGILIVASFLSGLFIKQPVLLFTLVLVYSGIEALFTINYFTATIRRLHDTDRNGWTMLLILIPILGSILLLCLLCVPHFDSRRFNLNPLHTDPVKQPGFWISLLLLMVIFVPFNCVQNNLISIPDSSNQKITSHSSKKTVSSKDDDDSSDDTDTGDFENKAVKGIDSDDYNSGKAANNNFSYGELIKSDDFFGKSFNLENAQVLQAEQSGNATTLLAYIDDDSDNLFKIYYADKTKAVEDSVINVQGILGNREDYDTKIGGTNTVPTLVAHKVTVIGTASDNE